MALVVPGPFPLDSSRVTQNERVARFKLALELKARRLPVTEIARRLGLSRTRTQELLKQALEVLFPDPEARAAKARELKLCRTWEQFKADVRRDGRRWGSLEKPNVNEAY